jgi:hypothetical protein
MKPLKLRIFLWTMKLMGIRVFCWYETESHGWRINATYRNPT